MSTPDFRIEAGDDPTNGVASIDPVTGAWSYTPNPDFNGTDSFTVSVTDDDGNVETQLVTLTVTPVNDDPIIVNLTGDNSQFVAGGGAAQIDVGGNAIVIDVDSADFSGGSISIAQTTGVANGSYGVDGATVTSGVDATITAGETIFVGGVAIGTVDAVNDGQGGAGLTINLNASATPARAAALLQGLTYTAPSGLGDRDFMLTLTDGDGGAGSATFTVSVAGNAPVISGLDGDSSIYNEGDTPVSLDIGGDALVTDSDSANFDGGNLTAVITGGGDASEDVLGVNTSGPVSVTGTTVSVGGVAIGTITSNGTGGNPLVITFNSSATPARVSTLAQALTYLNTDTTSPTPGVRSIGVTVRDSAPGPGSAVSAIHTMTVDVRQVVDPVSTLDLGPGLPPDFQVEPELQVEPAGFNGTTFEGAVTPADHVLPAVNESVRQRDAMVQRLSGAYTIREATEIQSASLSGGMPVDRQLFVLPAVAAVQQESAEVQARAQLLTARSSTGAELLITNLVEIPTFSSTVEIPTASEPAAANDGGAGDAMGAAPSAGTVTIGNLPAEDAPDSDADEVGVSEPAGEPHAAADGFARDVRDEIIPATSEEQSVRPLGATSFSALLRQESAKLRAHPFAGGALPAA